MQQPEGDWQAQPKNVVGGYRQRLAETQGAAHGRAFRFHRQAAMRTSLLLASRFGLKPADAKAILRQVFTAITAWRQTGQQLGLKAPVLDAYESAFDHEQVAEARRLLGGE